MFPANVPLATKRTSPRRHSFPLTRREMVDHVNKCAALHRDCSRWAGVESLAKLQQDRETR